MRIEILGIHTSRSHDFTELFLTTSLTRPRLLFTIKDKHKLFFYSSPQPHNPCENSSLVATPYRCTIVPKYRSTYMSKPVCGLVLLQGCGSRQWPLICNLAKGKVLTFPKILRKEEDYAKEIYLGYDPIGKQFKVLYLSMNYSRPNTNWILTLEYGKRFWRRIDTQLQP